MERKACSATPALCLGTLTGAGWDENLALHQSWHPSRLSRLAQWTEHPYIDIDTTEQVGSGAARSIPSRTILHTKADE